MKSFLLLLLPVTTALRGAHPLISRTLSTDISDPSHCYPLLHASSSPESTLDNTRYYYFVDSMSNSYFSSSNVTEYNELPNEIKYGFVTLSCLCQLKGERKDCCLAENAKLDSSGSDPDGPPPTEEQEAYLNDVCTTTAGSIGDKIAPESGELPTSSVVPTPATVGDDDVSGGVTGESDDVSGGTGTGSDDTVGTDEATPTRSPTPLVPEATNPDGTGENSGENDVNREVDASQGGLSGGAYAGIAIAAAAVGTMLLYLVMRRESDAEEEVELDGNGDANDLSKESNARGLAVKTDGDAEGGPISPASTMDATQSLTADAHSDTSSLPSSIAMSKSEESGVQGYNDLNLLPGRSDEESVLSGDEEKYFYSNSLSGMGAASGAMVGTGTQVHDDESSISSKSHSSSVLMEDALPTSSRSALPPQHYTPGELDQAIENGNWEAVAASAAAIVSQSRSDDSSSSGMKEVV